MSKDYMQDTELRVLFVSSGNSAGGISPFVKEQGEALKKLGVKVDFFPIKGKGFRGYLKNVLLLKKYLEHHHFDILHGHFIWSIMVCLFQKKIIKVGTFHGTDLNRPLFRYIADKIVMPGLALNIVVSNKMAEMVPNHKTSVIPCGIDFETFYPITDKATSTLPFIQKGKVNILFCSDFQRPVKNASLAIQAVNRLVNQYEINLLELKNLNREEVNLLLNDVDLVLMTSFTEGSPQIIKEAMACNCPIVSTDVGDVSDIVKDVEGCYITTFEPADVTAAITQAIQFKKRTTGREHIQRFSNQVIAECVKSEYVKLLNR